MKRNALLIPFIIFLIIAAALLWQLARNAQGDDPTNLESALIGKPVPTFRLEPAVCTRRAGGGSEL